MLVIVEEVTFLAELVVVTLLVIAAAVLCEGCTNSLLLSLWGLRDGLLVPLDFAGLCSDEK